MGVYATIKSWSSEKGCSLFDEMVRGITQMRGDNVYNCDDQYLKITDIEVFESRINHYKELLDIVKRHPDEYIFYG